MMTTERTPPGFPGIPPRWTSSAKSGVGTAAARRGRVWFTLSHGIVDEVYYPNVDQANTRDLQLLVAGPAGFFSEEKRDAAHAIAALAPGVPGYTLTNTCAEGRYRVEKVVVTDPDFEALLQYIHFTPLRGSLADYTLYALLAPHIGNRGMSNDSWAGDYKGVPMLFASRGGTCLALACSAPFAAMSCGYVGFSDGWQQVNAHGRLVARYPEARGGNIALTGEIDIAASGGRFALALAFGSSPAEAGQRARAALTRSEAETTRRYVAGWQALQARCLDLSAALDSAADSLYRTSIAVLKTHAATRLPGGICASLSIPWGASKGDDDLGGYHLIWPRDLVECAGALLAAGDAEGARETLRYLVATQEADGHWPQNMWLDGTPYWSGVQLDETALPVLLADALRRCDELGDLDPWPMVRRAAGFLARIGPVTQQDRWEEDGGFSPFTLAATIAALLAAADFADGAGDPALAAYLRETADAWNDSVERWTYVRDTPLARQVGVPGYYVRIAPPDVAEGASPAEGYVPIKNRPPRESSAPAAAIVSPDALALVRFGLRAPDDPCISATLRVIDALLRIETPTGPSWRRYVGDGYGEHLDGAPFDGVGVGRGWPLLTGERAHYELAAGRHDEATALLAAIGRQTSPGGMIPEQIWDGPDLPERELEAGRPAGSAMPLAWAHAEVVKLARSLRDGVVFDTPPQTRRRYQIEGRAADITPWRLSLKHRRLVAGRRLRVELAAPATVRWSADGWATVVETPTRDTGLGVHVADLPVAGLASKSEVRFTLRWANGVWEGQDYSVVVDVAEVAAPIAHHEADSSP